MIWSGALMLEHLGHAQAGAEVLAAIETLLADPKAPKTRDIGGAAGTREVGEAIAALLRWSSGSAQFQVLAVHRRAGARGEKAIASAAASRLTQADGSASGIAARLAGVSSVVGATLLTAMPLPASSAASVSTSRCSALLEAMWRP